MVQTTLFNAPPTSPTKTSGGGSTSIKLPTVTGRMFLTNTGEWFNVSRITTEYILKRSANPYYIRKKNELTNQMFIGDLKYEVFGPSGELDEKLSAMAKGMCNSMVEWLTNAPTSLYHHTQTAFADIFDGGCAIFEPVWATYNGWVVLYALNHLPFDTFQELPKGFDGSPAQLLKGLAINPTTQKLEYWQKQDDGELHLIQNVLHIKSPVSRDLAGDPLCMPILPIIDILNYLIEILRMKAGRVGAPSLFVEVLSDDEDTLAAAQDIIQNYGVKNQFAHNQNIRVYTVDLKEGGGIEEAINQFESVLDAIYNPAAMLEKSGTIIGGSDAGAERLIYTQANTMLGWLEVGLTSLLQKWLVLNGFDTSYIAKVSFPKLEPDKTTKMNERVRTGFDTMTLSRSERRKLLDAPPETPEIAAELEKEFGASSTPAATIQNTARHKLRVMREHSNEINEYTDPIVDQTENDIIEEEQKFESVIYAAMGIKA